MKMRPAIVLTAFGLLLAGFPAAAQTPPPPSKWDISKIDVSKLPPASDQKDVTFDKDILPLFKASCVGCHGEQKPKKNLRLDSLDAVLKGGRDGKMVIPSDSKNSLLLAAAAQIDDKIAMPPKPRQPPPGAPPPPAGGPNKPKPLTAEQVGLVRAWIDQGAK
jgi:hypothetical protein